MKEFINKLIERLEEEHEKCINRYGVVGGNLPAMEVKQCMEIVNQLAEEYKSTEYINCSTDSSTDTSLEEYDQTIDVAELVEKFGQKKVRSNDGWILCEERLPDDFMSMEYLTTVKGRFYSEINYYCVVNHKWYSNERTTKEVNVIAWMPKPTVYQPKGE